jgi:KDO2-lipid IV(A) lauroyltransferase
LVEYLLFRFALATIAFFPPLARVYVKLLDLAVPRLRRIAIRNLEIAKIPTEGIVDGVFRSIARILVSFAKFPGITEDNVRQMIGYQGFENFENALKKGRGVLVATAHFGNWELSAFAHACLTVRCTS